MRTHVLPRSVGRRLLVRLPGVCTLGAFCMVQQIFVQSLHAGCAFAGVPGGVWVGRCVFMWGGVSELGTERQRCNIQECYFDV